MTEFMFSNVDREMEVYGYDAMVKSHCRMCHGGCGVLVYIKAGKVAKIAGDPDCPIHHGTLCAKGLASAQLAYHPDRLTYPVKRVGPKASGQWKRISWEEALNTIAKRILEYKEKVGPESVVFGYGTGQEKEAVIEAIADGRQAAISIDRYIEGLDLRLGGDVGLKATTTPQKGKYDPSPRSPMPRLEAYERARNFNEVQTGLRKEMVTQEAQRCISCGSCCIQACPYDAIAFDPKLAKIQKCNLCYHRVTNGLYPACADNVCLAHCIYFGEPTEIERRILEKRKIRGGWGEILPKALIDSRE